MADKKLYVKSPYPQIEGGDPLYIDRELGKIEIGFQQIERTLASNAVDQDARDAVSGVQTRVSTLEATSNNALALIEEERRVRAEADIAEAYQRLTLKAELNGNLALVQEELTARVTLDEAFAQSLTTLRTEFDDNVASVTDELYALSTANSSMAGTITALSANVELNTAGLIEERLTRVTQDEALSARLTTLTTNFNNNTATVNQNLLALSNADSSLAQSITNLNTVVGENVSNIYKELTALSKKDESLATDISTVTTSVGTKVRTFYQANPPLNTVINKLTTGDLWFETDQNNKIWRWDGGTWVEMLDPVSLTNAAVSNEAIARTTADSALAQNIQTVTTNLNGFSNTVQTVSESINGIKAKWGVTINNNGAITGIELNSGADRKSEFKIQADKFYIAPQNGETTIPFRVENNMVYMNEANIKNGTVSQIASTNFLSGNVVTLTLSGVPAGTPCLIFASGCAVEGMGINMVTYFNVGDQTAPIYQAIGGQQIVFSTGSTVALTCYRAAADANVIIMALKK